MKFHFKLMVALFVCFHTIPAHAMLRHRCNSVHSVRRYGSHEMLHDAGKLALALGCFAAIGYGIYKLCDWIFGQSDEQIIQESSQAAFDARDQFDELISFFTIQLGDIPANYKDQKKIIQSVQEPFLYQYSLILQENKDSINYKLQSLENILTRLAATHTTLTNRLAKLYKNNKSPGLIMRMEEINADLNEIRHKIEFIHEYLAQHKNYFILFDAEAHIMRTYESELNAFINYANNIPYVREVLRVSIMTHAAKHHISYPYMRYIEIINSDCTVLERSIDLLAHNYSNRISAARHLAQNMRALYSMLLVEDAYHQEMRDYEKAQLEKQRIEAEQAKAAAAYAQAAAAQAQAAALQQQAWEMAKQNHLHAQQIQVTQEQNALIAAQTFVNAINPPQPPEIHVYV